MMMMMQMTMIEPDTTAATIVMRAASTAAPPAVRFNYNARCTLAMHSKLYRPTSASGRKFYGEKFLNTTATASERTVY